MLAPRKSEAVCMLGGKVQLTAGIFTVDLRSCAGADIIASGLHQPGVDRIAFGIAKGGPVMLHI